jgi:DNA polymerase III delta prime subunit
VNLTHSPQRLNALERLLTRQRLTYYLELSHGDIAEAIRLYELNTRLSAMFYGPVQGMEVLVRNAINEQLIAKFGEDWHELQAIRLDYPQQDDVRRAIADVDGELNNGAVVAKLSLGFWAALLNTTNDNEIWRKAAYSAFPHRPKGTERKTIHGALNSIRRLRNRIAHHEKILHRDLTADHKTILEIAGWICPETSAWIASLSTFDASLLPADEGEELPLAAPAPAKEPQPTRDGRPRLGIKGA